MPFSRIHGFKIILTLQIGEGAFGEVFLLSTDSFPVLKIVAVDGSAPVNGQPQTKLTDMLAEIIITSELSKLRDFVGNFRAKNLYGIYMKVKCLLFFS